jgi:hypothetical protein
MSSAMKAAVVVLALLVIILVAMQFVMGQSIYLGNPNPKIRVMHRHTGYTAVALTIVYVVVTAPMILRAPSRAN